VCAYLNQEWRDWPIEKLEHEYAPSEWAKRTYSEYAPFLERLSNKAKLALGASLIIDRYGPRPRNVISWAPPTSRDEIFVWIHGGYWQGSSIDEALIGADDLVSQGFGFAAIEYTLAPDVSVREIVDECASALAWLREHNSGKSVILGGHSAGAHLALGLAQRNEVDGLVLVSGVFDLRPLVPTTINEPLGLDDAEAFSLSPISAEFPFACKAEVLVGGDESPSFEAQSKVAFDYLSDNSSPTELIVVEGLDHFDIILNGEHLKSFLRLADR
jgi:arylformamidase